MLGFLPSPTTGEKNYLLQWVRGVPPRMELTEFQMVWTTRERIPLLLNEILILTTKCGLLNDPLKHKAVGPAGAAQECSSGRGFNVSSRWILRAVGSLPMPPVHARLSGGRLLRGIYRGIVGLYVPCLKKRASWQIHSNTGKGQRKRQGRKNKCTLYMLERNAFFHTIFCWLVNIN